MPTNQHTSPTTQGYNPYLRQFLTLYSQSRITNRGTRGLDAFAKETYVPTKLDLVLKDRVLNGIYRLVIITGNAGDGKTAFIQQLEEEIKEECEQFNVNPNGAHFLYQNHEFITNYDGSQDVQGVQNDEVLKEFFSDFRGKGPPSFNHSKTAIIAINEGRLIEFLEDFQKDYEWLYNAILASFDEAETLPPELLIVNLKLRSIVDAELTLKNQCLFEKILDKFCEPKFWQACGQCSFNKKCYVKFNVDSMNDSKFGNVVRSRLKTLFQTILLRKRIDYTIRDLRSALSFILFNVSDCPEIQQLYEEDKEECYSRFYYNAVFGSSFEDAPRLQDRLLASLSEIDVGRVANPKLDNAINFIPPDKQNYTPKFPNRYPTDKEFIFQFYQQRSSSDTETEGKNRQRLLMTYHKGMRRKIYFESTEELWKSMLPYRQLQLFMNILSNKEDLMNIRKAIARAISLSEHIYKQNIISGHLCIRTGNIEHPRVKSFYLHPITNFACEIPTIGPIQEVIEYTPDTIYFKLRDSTLVLEINLDLFEMLYRILAGYSPSLNELKGSFQNLIMFKNQLTNYNYDRLLLTEDEINFYQVRKTEDNRLVMEPVIGGL